jgi:hypothetical protein
MRCCIGTPGHNTKMGSPTSQKLIILMPTDGYLTATIIAKIYNHSTFVDNVLAGLIGLRAQSGDAIVVNPLTPASWDYFAVENVAYHGHSITVLWDRIGSVYNRGEGLRVYLDGQLAGSRRTIGLIKVVVGPSIPTPVSSRINIAANSQRDPQLPLAFASYTSPVDDPMRAINGMIFRTGIPQNSRWTSYNSPNQKGHFGIDMHKDQAVDNVRLFFYDDSGGVRIPTTFDLQYWPGSQYDADQFKCRDQD